MRIDILTLFPEMVIPILRSSILGRAIRANQIEVHVHNIRDWAKDSHRTVDDAPYGGGPGMVMKCDVVVPALEEVQSKSRPTGWVIYPTPDGTPLRQSRVEELARMSRIVLLCGHYEGLDQRIRDGWVDEEISLGDYVLTGGELPALVILDAMVRLVPGVVGNPESTLRESHGPAGLLDHTHYTRPVKYRGLQVPPVLISGNHGMVDSHRLKESEERTRLRRPELFARAGLRGKFLENLLSHSSPSLIQQLANAVSTPGQMIVGVYEQFVAHGQICCTALVLDSDGTVWGMNSAETGDELCLPKYSGVLVIPTTDRARGLGAADGVDGFLGKLLLSYLEAPKVRPWVHPPQLRFCPIPGKSGGSSGTFVIELRSGLPRERVQGLLPSLLSGLTDPSRTLEDSLREFARALHLRYGLTEIPEIRGPEQL